LVLHSILGGLNSKNPDRQESSGRNPDGHRAELQRFSLDYSEGDR
jgi:hypothetical protein